MFEQVRDTDRLERILQSKLCQAMVILTFRHRMHAASWRLYKQGYSIGERFLRIRENPCILSENGSRVELVTTIRLKHYSP